MPDALADSPDSGKIPSHARIVIIGGGIMGCAVAYHLAKAGVSDAVLLEKGELTSGSTWHAAGQITYATSSYTLGKCVAYNLALYNSLEAETGQSVTWHGCGSLRIAYTTDEVDWLEQIVSVAHGLDLPLEIVNTARIKELHPFYNTEDIRTALHTPLDGHVDPAGASFAMAKGAKMGGVKVIRRCRVTGVTALDSGEWQVSTEQGDIVCEHVVNAGGTYARQIALWSGYDLPATNMTHHYFITEPVPEFKQLTQELPVVRDDSVVSGYVRMEQKSGLIGIYEKENPNVVWENGTPWEAENELFEPDYDRVMPWLANALERMPILSKLGIRRAVHGAISHPPDGNPLIGPAPGLRNYWCCCGCQIGVGWGPSLARELVRWILDGAADFNMREFDPRRFGEYADQSYQVAKAKEDYTLRHEIPFPHFNRLAKRPVKCGPLYERLRDKGAVYEEVYGWERPRWFAKSPQPAEDIYSFRRSKLHDIIRAEVAAVSQSAGIVDISAFAKIEVRAAPELIDGLIPNRLPKVGRIGLTHLLTQNGRIELETTIARLADERFYFTCAAFFEQRLCEYLKHYLGNAAIITNCSNEWGAMAINGPKSRDILAACTPDNVSKDAFPWLSVQPLAIAGKPLYALRMSYAGELGWELHGDNDAIAAAYDALSAAGSTYDIGDYGVFAMNAMRMEKAFQGAGELTNEVTLPEADVMRFVQLNKPAFIGKAATLNAMQAPLRWRCAYLAIEDEAGSGDDGNGGEGVFADGKRIGMISSIAYGHRVCKLLAFAYIAPQYATAETECEVIIMGKLRQAHILTKAAYDSDNARVRA